MVKYSTKLNLGAIIQILILIGVFLGIAYFLITGSLPAKKELDNLLDYNLFLKAKATSTENLNVFIGQNSIKAVAPAYYYFEEDLEVMGSLITPETDINLEKLLDAIKFCESGNNYLVCSYKGCNAGQGLYQIIPSTLKECEEVFKRKLDVFNPEDNKECAIYLLTETEQGINHWGYPATDSRGYVNGERWGSLDCIYEKYNY